MAKARPRRIASDDCEIMVDGQLCRPHEGEWVEMIATEAVGELAIRQQYARLRVELDAIKGEPSEGARYQELMDSHYRSICEFLERRVFAWSWTDHKGRPLPQPDKPDVLMSLSAGELYWLLNAVGGETPTERKND